MPWDVVRRKSTVSTSASDIYNIFAELELVAVLSQGSCSFGSKFSQQLQLKLGGPVLTSQEVYEMTQLLQVTLMVAVRVCCEPMPTLW
eukprot:1163667-Amphidinium_carterae.1